jgi:hypothetical protein
VKEFPRTRVGGSGACEPIALRRGGKPALLEMEKHPPGGDIMTVELSEQAGGKVIEVRLSGKLHKDDYQHFGPAVERTVAAHGKVRMLVEMHDFHGWDMGALWEDIKFDLKHFKDIERLALVGEKKWEHGMATFCKPFTTASIRYFDVHQIDEARQWVAAS